MARSPGPEGKEMPLGGRRREMTSQIITLLLERGLISKEDLERVFPLGHPPGDISPEEHLFKTEIITREDFKKAAEEFFETSFATPDDFPREPMLFNHLSVQFMKESKFIPAAFPRYSSWP